MNLLKFLVVLMVAGGGGFIVVETAWVRKARQREQNERERRIQGLVAAGFSQEEATNMVAHQWAGRAIEYFSVYGKRIGELIQRVARPGIPGHEILPLAMVNGQKHHTCQTYLNHAAYFLVLGDCNQACEKIWMAASLAIKIFAAAMGVQYTSHDAARKISHFIGQYSTLGENGNGYPIFDSLFSSVQRCHRKSYEEGLTPEEISMKIDDAVRYINDFGNIYAHKEDLENKMEELRTACNGLKKGEIYFPNDP